MGKLHRDMADQRMEVGGGEEDRERGSNVIIWQPTESTDTVNVNAIGCQPMRETDLATVDDEIMFLRASLHLGGSRIRAPAAALVPSLFKCCERRHYCLQTWEHDYLCTRVFGTGKSDYFQHRSNVVAV